MGGDGAVPTAREEEMGAVDEFFESWWSLVIAVIWAVALVYMHMTRPQQQQEEQLQKRQHQPAQGKEAVNSSAKTGKVGRRGKRDKCKDS